MSSMYGVSLCLLLFAGVLSSPQKSRKDAIGFPEVEEDSRLQNKENRQPVYIPAQCPDNELYYPGDQKDDWICDCRPGHIYHPASDRCWPTWWRGPCPEGEYLYLPRDTVIPACQKNPCHHSGYVYWPTTAKCERLGSSTPCAQMNPVTTTLSVNATTLQVECIKVSFENRFSEPEPEQVAPSCPPRTKRSIQKKC